MLKIKDRVKLSKAKYHLDPKGAGYVTQINGDAVEVCYCGIFRRAWLLPDGSLSAVRAVPWKRYTRKLDRYEPDPKGIVEIVSRTATGWMTSMGEETWLDYDGTLSLTPVDFSSRIDAWYDMSAQNKPRKFKRFQVNVYWLPDGGYRYIVTHLGKTKHEGFELTQVQAEREGSAWVKKNHRGSMCWVTYRGYVPKICGPIIPGLDAPPPL